ncbi:unnamed protein product [Rhizoctonia solani]|uniref:TM7S3/TM198-like domain-containing protein n=1 Tax=Rhizoctonia solani TaxID=456999 RepID=A0A8H3HES7_9AGAM|nr:unnamed protein product [Rhizoctonia solani]CAE6506155.1 unnamed protein product [Rhizoctonia solani]
MRKCAPSDVLYCIYVTLLLFSLGGVNAGPTLAARAIIRPIPMPGFNVSVFDDVTGAPIPQVPASDGGGLINGGIFSAPNIIWAIFAAVIGIPLGAAGVRLWRVTTALGGGLVLAFAMWAALINTISESGLASSQSMSDMLILLITGAAFLVGMIGGAFRLLVLPAMAATCALGGSSIAVRGVILRPGLLVPPGQTQQLAFVNIVIVAVGALAGGLSVIFKQRESMIFSTSCVGSFLIALAVDLLVNGQDGMSRGLRFLFDMNDNHLADLVGGGYNPPLSSQITVAGSLGLALILCIIQHFAFTGPFRQPRPRDRTQSIEDSASEKGSFSSSQGLLGRTPVASRTIQRGSVLSLFHVPERSSGAGSVQKTIESGVPPFRKPTIERPWSAAYNHGQGIYALPSELLRQPSQGQSQTRGPYQPNFQRPLALSAPGQPSQFTGIGLRSYQNQFVAVRNNQARNLNGLPVASIRHRNAQPVVTSPRDTPTRFGNPRDAGVAIPRAGGGFNTPGANRPTGLQIPSSRNIPPSGTTVSAVHSPANFEPASNPGLGIGMGMLRMSMDSIIDAYGGTNDTGYRYGGSRTGEGGRI